MSTLFVVLLLSAMWIAVLAAPLLQSRGRSNSRGDSIKSFERRLAVLGKANGDVRSRGRAARPEVLAHPMGHASNREAPRLASVPATQVRNRQTGADLAAQRRRRIMTALGATALFTLALAFVSGGLFIWVHLLVDILLAGYVVALFQIMKTIAEREMKVAFLPHASSQAEPARMLREVAQGR